MITSFFIAVFVSIINLILGLLPIGTLPAAVSSSITYISGVLNTFNYLFPISDLFIVLSLVITVELILWLFHVTIWVYHKIRGI